MNMFLRSLIVLLPVLILVFFAKILLVDDEIKFTDFESKNFPEFSAGDTITVYYEIREGDKVRTQSFKGVVIQVKGRGLSKTFTIRKMSGTVGVERVFPINMPALGKIEVNKKGKVRQSRIYYFRELRGKKARIKEV